MNIVNKLPLKSRKFLRNFVQDYYLDLNSILTKKETEEMIKNIESGFINSKDINWDHFEDFEF